MTTTDPHPHPQPTGQQRVRHLASPDEASLLAAAREGSCGALAVLYAEHRPHALAVARRTLGAADASVAEDVTEVAFVRVFQALANGGGPRDTLRHYLATSVRREAWRAQRRQRRQAEIADRWAVDEPVVAEPEMARRPGRPEASGHALLAQAFAGLPDRWREALWLTEVEGRPPGELAELVGVPTPGAAAALAYRARRGLLKRYVAVHRMSAPDAACRAVAPELEAYLAEGRDGSAHPDVVAHLEGCGRCRDVCRGIDVLGESALAVLPLGALSAGWWAQGLVGGSAGGGAAAGAAAATAVAGSGLGASAGGGAGAGSAGMGTTAGAVAAAVAAAVAVGALVAGAVGWTPDGPSEVAAPEPVASSTEADGPPRPPGPAGATAPSAVPPEVPASTPLPSASPSPTSTTTSTAPERPPGPEAPPASPIVRTPAARPAGPTTTAPPTTTPTTTTTSSPPSTTTPTTTEPPTTTTTEVPMFGGWVAGRVLDAVPGRPDLLEPRSGVGIVVDGEPSRPRARMETDVDGRYRLSSLPPGVYRLVVELPAGRRLRGVPVGGSSVDLGLIWVGSGGTIIGDLVLEDAGS